MRSLFLQFVFYTLIALCLSIPLASQAATKTAPLEVSGWIPYWRVATGTADALVHLDSFTEINPFGYTVKTDGTLKDSAGLEAGAWDPLIAAAKKKKVRVIPTVMWSDTEAIHNILSNSKSRIALEENIASTTKKNGYDGIDIDFEGKKAEDKNYFSTFLKGLYARMGKKWVMCSIEARTPVEDRYDGTPPPDATTYANDYVAINKYCDRVRLMTYDQGTIDLKLNEAQGGPYIPLADPKWVEKVVTLASKTISKKKIEIGVPTYGYEYQATPLSEDGFRYDLQWAFNPKYALDLAGAYQALPVRNAAGELSFAFFATSSTPVEDSSTTAAALSLATTSYAQTAGTQGSPTQPFNIVWWSDSKAIADKIALAKKLGVRGVSIFKIDGGEDPAIWSVLPSKK